MRAARKSSFGELVAYLVSDQGNEIRVAAVRVTHCESADVESAVLEVLAIQAQNRRATSDKTYHLILSFPTGEVPSTRSLHAIEDRVCKALGFAGHQRVSVVHRDTDNVHIHLAINKVHPKTLRVHDPWQDFKTLATVCVEVEVEFSLQRDNHEPRHHHGLSTSQDAERRSGIESLSSWIRRTCADGLLTVRSWTEAHQHLKRHGLTLMSRGSGLAFMDSSGLAVRASQVDRRLARGAFEARLGPFEPALSPRAPAEQANAASQRVPALGEAPFVPNDGVVARGFQGLEPETLLSCGSWAEFHRALAGLGVQARLRGAGLVFHSGGRRERASEVSRHLSLTRLEKLWGPYEVDCTSAPATHVGSSQTYAGSPVGSGPFDSLALTGGPSEKLWLMYLETRRLRSKQALEQRRAAHKWFRQEISAALRRAQLKRGLILRLGKGRASKLVLYASVHATLQREIESTKALHARRLSVLDAGGHRLGWTEWLRRRALQGDAHALSALRSCATECARELGCGALHGPLGAASVARAQVITRRGTLIFREGPVEWRETADAVKVHPLVEGPELATLLALAARRFGPLLHVAGSDEFKQRAVESAVQSQLAIEFDDPDLEARRRSLPILPKATSTAIEVRHGSRLGLLGGGQQGRFIRPHRRLRESDAGGAGTAPASDPPNRVRTVSQLDVVQLSAGGKVLLPGDARHQLEHSGAGPADSLRRHDVLSVGGATGSPPSTPVGEPPRSGHRRRASRMQR